MQKRILIIACLLSTIKGFGQNATKYSNEFLQIGVGARSLAMGGAMIASAKDVYAGYWNPAGLTKIDKNSQVALMHASYFAGIANYDYGAYATKTGTNSALGISMVRFGVDGIANTFDLIRNGEIDYTRVTSFNTTDFAAIVSYAQEADIKELRNIDFSWGANMKIIHRKVGPFANAWGFGFDAAMRMENTKKNWALGVVVRDVTSTFNSWRYTFTDAQKDVLAATQNAIPKNTLEITLPRIIGGFAKTWEKNNWIFLAELDANITLDGKRNTLIKTNLLSIDPYIGGEIGYSISDENKVYFRTGLNNYQQYTNNNGKKVPSVMPNVGVGITLGKFTIDYALTNLSAVAGNGPSLYSNVFSLKLAIDKESKK
ncbi:MAG: PorV/PorQ family protein [bacterium]|nr:PorV/PorQ family protein [bacterium]